MFKVKPDTILRCANAECYHNRDGYTCDCRIITLNANGQCALVQPESNPVPEVRTITKFPDGTESETTTIII